MEEIQEGLSRTTRFIGEHRRAILQNYRLACEAAHMGDLVVYIPPHPQEPGLRLSDLSMLRTYTSLKFGIILACDLLHDASDTLGIGADEQINSLRKRWQVIIAIGPNAQE